MMGVLRLFRRSSEPSASEVSETKGHSRFPFLPTLEDEVVELMEVRTEDKLIAFQAGAEFWMSNRGQRIQEEVVEALAASGYPELAARFELSLLSDFLLKDSLEPIVSNPAALHGGTKWLDGDFVELASGVFITSFPVGPLLVIGSGNALMPAIVSAIEGLLANCPIALRGSRVNQVALERVFGGLQEAGNATLSHLIAKVHPFFLDHQDPDEGRLLSWLLRHGPFGGGNFWGGQEALDYLISEFAKNPRHPTVIPMEPMTGVAVVSQQYVDSDSEKMRASAKGLAEAIRAMGQQLCSSPTEAYFIGDFDSAVAFMKRVALELEEVSASDVRRIGESQALLLDRVRNQLEEAGSIVITPRTRSAQWTLAVSHQQSGFGEVSQDCRIPIHNRTGFLELITVDSLDTVTKLISALPTAPCHSGIRRVQTIVRFMSLSEAKELMLRLRAVGVYRVVPPEYVVLRNALEPLDGRHLVSELTRQMVVF